MAESKECLVAGVPPLRGDFPRDGVRRVNQKDVIRLATEFFKAGGRVQSTRSKLVGFIELPRDQCPASWSDPQVDGGDFGGILVDVILSGTNFGEWIAWRPLAITLLPRSAVG